MHREARQCKPGTQQYQASVAESNRPVHVRTSGDVAVSPRVDTRPGWKLAKATLMSGESAADCGPLWPPLEMALLTHR